MKSDPSIAMGKRLSHILYFAALAHPVRRQVRVGAMRQTDFAQGAL
jgi:hypothetical protein